MDTTNEWTWVIKPSASKPYSVYYDAFFVHEGKEYVAMSGVHMCLNTLAVFLTDECNKRNSDSWLGLIIEVAA